MGWKPPYWVPYYPPGYVPFPICPTVTPWTPPTVAQFKAQFFRDFPYAPAGNASLEYVQDQDITNAINLANVDFNSDLFGINNMIIFMYLAAHYMVLAIQNSSMGLNSQAKFPLESSSVGGVSITNRITDKLVDDPNYSKYLTTGYGQIYLEMVYPYTVGNIGIIPGTTTSS